MLMSFHNVKQSSFLLHCFLRFFKGDIDFNLVFSNRQSELPTNEDEASRGAGAQSVTVNRLVVGLIPTRGNKIFI